MYLLYLDESGQHGGRYFVLAGVAAFERQTHWIATELDRVQAQYFPKLPGAIELHASQVRAGRESPWDQLQPRERHALLDDVYTMISQAQVVIFGIAIERRWLPPGTDEYSYAFESLTQQFDRFLIHRYRDAGDPQRGLIVLAESEYRRRIEGLARRIRAEGTRWGDLRNLSEIPLFTAAGNSRLLQVADFCANAIYGRYESGYTTQFDRLLPKVYQDQGVYYGLWHYCVDHDVCGCPACLSRRLSGGGDRTEDGQRTMF